MQTDGIIEPMYLHNIVTNPAGKGSAYLGNRVAIKENLQSKYNKLIYIYKKFDYKLYKIGDNYVFHFKIPSETYKNLYYDVVLEFYPDESVNAKNDRNLNRYFVNVFSNSPAFMFTYTYVINHNGMIPVGLKKFCSKTALRERPSVRNPVETYGFEKSVYFAALYIINNKLYDKFKAESSQYKFKKDTFDNTIQSQENKLIEYNKAKEKATKERRQERQAQKMDVIKKVTDKKKNKKLVRKNTTTTKRKK